jgi:hypothetical protein
VRLSRLSRADVSSAVADARRLLAVRREHRADG